MPVSASKIIPPRFCAPLCDVQSGWHSSTSQTCWWMPNVFESRASGNQELIYPENKSSLDRSTAIANTTASKMSENDWNSQSRARSGHDLRPLQRLVHNGCLVAEAKAPVPHRHKLRPLSHGGRYGKRFELNIATWTIKSRFEAYILHINKKQCSV